MPEKNIIYVNLAAPNPNVSPATRFGNLVFIAGYEPAHHVRLANFEASQQISVGIEKLGGTFFGFG